MSFDWGPPSKKTALNTASTILGLLATREQVIGWGPWVADRWHDIEDRPFEALALAAALLLLFYAHWRGALRALGFREKPGPRWPDEQTLRETVHSWGSRHVTVTDQTIQMQAKAKARGVGDVSFSFIIGASNPRPVTVTKMASASSMRFSARVTPDGGHPAVIKAMSDNAYADMQEEIGVELIKAGFSAVITSRLIEDRGQKTDADGNELPVGVFISDIAFVDTISEEEFFEHINQMMRGVAIAQALIRRHVRLADPSGAPSDQATAPALAVVTDSTAATATEGGDQVPDVETS